MRRNFGSAFRITAAACDSERARQAVVWRAMAYLASVLPLLLTAAVALAAA